MRSAPIININCAADLFKWSTRLTAWWDSCQLL